MTDIYDRRESVVRSYCRSFPVSFVRAEGAVMTDADGRDYIDFLGGCSSLNYGHNDPDMRAALIEHIQACGLAQSLDMHTDVKAAFLEAVEEIILKPRNMPHRVMMTGPTGTNAVEAAMKLARKVTGRRTVMAFTNGFHGMTMGALAATSSRGKRGGAGPQPLEGVQRLPYDGAFGPDTDTLPIIEALLDNPSGGYDAPAAFLFEPVQGEGGLTAASERWMKGVAEIAKKHGALLIVDDIQSGCGRTGPYFSFERMGIEADLIPMAKSFSGMGLPMAAVLVKPEHDIWKPAEHNGTFRGNAHAFVTARVALEKFWRDDRLETETDRKAKIINDRLSALAKEVPGGRVKGRGMMQGIDVGSGELASRICALCFDKGLIIETSGAWDEVVKILTPLIVPDDLLTRGLDIIEAATREALQGRDAAE
ncbi:MAG: aspartate aminotransferase family protein [Pseudomonadota bacterium]